MNFRFEYQLVQRFIDLSDYTCMGNSFWSQLMANEYDYNNGRVDIVTQTSDKELVAIEAKLLKWRSALNQAYRNTSFAHYSFVLLPEKIAYLALEREKDFKNRGVGVLSIINNQVKILLVPQKKKPLQPWLTKKAFEYINQQNNEKVSIRETGQ